MLIDVKIMMVVHIMEKYWVEFEVISILSWWKHPPLGGTGMTSKLAPPKANPNFNHASMFVCFVHCVPGTCVQLLLLGITCAPSRLVYCCTGLEGDQVYTPESVHPPESGANLHCGQPPTTRHASQGCAQPMQQQNNTKYQQIQSLYCEQIFKKEFFKTLHKT